MVFQIASEAGAAETGDIEAVDGQIVAVGKYLMDWNSRSLK